MQRAKDRAQRSGPAPQQQPLRREGAGSGGRPPLGFMGHRLLNAPARRPSGLRDGPGSDSRSGLRRCASPVGPHWTPGLEGGVAIDGSFSSRELRLRTQPGAPVSARAWLRIPRRPSPCSSHFPGGGTRSLSHATNTRLTPRRRLRGAHTELRDI